MRGLDRKRSRGEQSGGEQLDSKQEGDARARSGFWPSRHVACGGGQSSGQPELPHRCCLCHPKVQRIDAPLHDAELLGHRGKGLARF